MIHNEKWVVVKRVRYSWNTCMWQRGDMFLAVTASGMVHVLNYYLCLKGMHHFDEFVDGMGVWDISLP